MPERVVQTVLAEKTGRLRKEKMVYRLRISLALVAAALLLAVGAEAAMTWNSARNTSPARPVGLTSLQQLEARPLHIPLYSTLADCKESPVASPYGWGTPIAGYGQTAYASDWGYYVRMVFYTDETIRGPILVRGRDTFKPLAEAYVGDFATGPVAGSDTIGGTTFNRRTELVLSEDRVSTTFASDMAVPTGKRYIWQFLAAIPRASSGYSIWQIDAAGVSELLSSCSD